MAEDPRARDAHPVTRVVVPVEGSDREYLAQEHAVLTAAALGAPMVAVHVTHDLDEPEAQRFHYLRQAADRWGVQLQTQVLAGTDPAAVLLEELAATDLVVVGTRHAGRRYHVGSVTQALIASAPCAVQVLRIE